MLRHLPIAALFWAAISCSSEESVESRESDQSKDHPGLVEGQVLLTTNFGDIVIELYPDEAPLSVANFLSYLEKGHYDGSHFHRVIDGYLIEAGRFRNEDGSLVEQSTGDSIANEARNGLLNERGSLAMARMAQPDSATSAFFINLGDNLALNHPQPDGHGYAVFGRVVSGMEIADEIGRVDTDVIRLNLLHPSTGKHEPQDVADVPIEPVTIDSARMIAK